MSKNVKIFEVTIRDGSYAIDFQFTQEDVRFLCGALEDAGFEYIEVGHGFGLNAAGSKGASAVTDEQSLAAASAALKKARFGTFFIPGVGEKEHLRRARTDFGMHFVRIGYNAEEIEKTYPYIEYARELGYEVMANFMKTYVIPPKVMGAKCRELESIGAQVVYVVDSAGCMMPDHVAEYTRAVADSCGATIGFHGHNNLELAGANAIAAAANGATMLDTSVGGLGRSAGNTRTEMLIPALRRLGYRVDGDMSKVLELLKNFIGPLLQRRAIDPVTIASGWARVHSGMMDPFEKCSAKYGLSLEDILMAYGDSDQNTPKMVDGIGKRLAESPAPRRSAPGDAENVLLSMHGRTADPANINISLVAIDELLRAAGALARKGNMPIVLRVSFRAQEGEEFAPAAYDYHDDHFVVLRAVFASAEQFLSFMSIHRRSVDVLVFDETFAKARDVLVRSTERWKDGKRVAHIHKKAHNYHALLTRLTSVCGGAATGAGDGGRARVLLFGGNPIDFAAHLPPDMEDIEFYFLQPGAAGHSFQPLRVDRANGMAARRPADDNQRFQAFCALSPVDEPQLRVISGHLAADATVIDCAGHGDVLQNILGADRRTVSRLDLHRTLTGELISLFAGEIRK